MNAKIKKEATVTFRLPEINKRALEKAAEDDRRPTTTLVEKIVDDWLRAKGYIQ